MKSTPNGKGRKRQRFFQETEWLSGPPELLSVLIWLKQGWSAKKGLASHQRKVTEEPIPAL